MTSSALCSLSCRLTSAYKTSFVYLKISNSTHRSRTFLKFSFSSVWNVRVVVTGVRFSPRYPSLAICIINERNEGNKLLVYLATNAWLQYIMKVICRTIIILNIPNQFMTLHFVLLFATNLLQVSKN